MKIIVIDVRCVFTDTDFSNVGADLKLAAQRWGFRPFALFGRGDIVNCASVDEAFLNSCGTFALGNDTLPTECLFVCFFKKKQIAKI